MINAHTVNGTAGVAIFSRILESAGESLSVDVAHHILEMRFSAEDKARMHELAEKNQGGEINPQELEELDNHIAAGDILAIWQSKARQVLMPRHSVLVEHGRHRTPSS